MKGFRFFTVNIFSKTYNIRNMIYNLYITFNYWLIPQKFRYSFFEKHSFYSFEMFYCSFPSSNKCSTTV